MKIKDYFIKAYEPALWVIILIALGSMLHALYITMMSAFDGFTLYHLWPIILFACITVVVHNLKAK